MPVHKSQTISTWRSNDYRKWFDSVAKSLIINDKKVSTTKLLEVLRKWCTASTESDKIKYIHGTEGSSISKLPNEF